MTAELGGFTGIVAPDAETVRFLRERRGVEFALEPWMRSDPGAAYAEMIRVDCAALPPMVARPGDPGNGVPLAELAEPVTHRHRLRRLVHRRQARGLRPLPRGAGVGRRRAACAWRRGVQLYLQFGTTAVRDYCIAPRLHSTHSRRSARASCSRPAAPAPTAGPAASTRRGPGDGQRDQPQLSRALAARARSGSPARRRWRPARSPARLVSFENLKKRHACRPRGQ